MRVFFKGLTLDKNEVAGTIDVDVGLPDDKKIRVMFQGTVGLFYHEFTNIPDISGIKVTSLDTAYMPEAFWLEYERSEIDTTKIIREIKNNVKEMVRHKSEALIHDKVYA